MRNRVPAQEVDSPGAEGETLRLSAALDNTNQVRIHRVSIRQRTRRLGNGRRAHGSAADVSVPLTLGRVAMALRLTGSRK